MDITNDTLREFLKVNSSDDGFITDLGYLLIPADDRLNSEAMTMLKIRFKSFVADQKKDQ